MNEHIDSILSASDKISSLLDRLNKIIKQISLAWPFLCILALMIIQVLIANLLSIECQYIFNEILSFLLKIIGLFLVLYSLNKKVEVIIGDSLNNLSVDWVKKFTTDTKNLEFKAISGNVPIGSSDPKFLSFGPADSIENKIDNLQKKVNYLKQQHEEDINSLKEMIRQNSRQTDKCINQTQSSINLVKDQVRKTTVGGLDRQVFGICLVFYGDILNFIKSFG